MIHFEKQNRLALVTLNREPALNSLNLEMVRSLCTQLPDLMNDEQVAIIFIQGSGSKAFCAGGDVKSVCQRFKSGDFEYGADFFTTEYQADLALHTSPKPVIVLGHGIVMGGGIGLFAGGTLRIATTSSMFAMPEISIGLFPDVGGSYFLNRMPGKVGLFLALTGARFNATDALFVGLANAFISDSAIPDFVVKLTEEKWSDSADTNRDRLKTFASELNATNAHLLPPAQIEPVLSVINETLASDNALIAFDRLRALSNHANPWLAKASANFIKGSPTSAHLIFEQLRRARHLPLKDCFEMELKMALQCCRKHDFYEGVRAVLIDKDQNPRWQPETWDKVDASLIESHFQKV